jgi:hypothetical protein
MPLRHRVSAAAAERRARPGRDKADEGFVMSSPLALMSAAAVLMAGVAFMVTDPAEPGPEQALLAAGPAPTEEPVTIDSEPVEIKKKKAPPPVQRGEVYVDVFNNTNISGLAGATASRIGGAGWQVTGSDNWVGTIPATTIYFPPRFKDAADLLSKDLGVTRVLPAVDPMSMDRLTVILTADFA